MIHRFNNAEKDKLFCSIQKAPALLRIRALYRAYGMERSFISFYGDDKGEILICLQKGFAILHIESKFASTEANAASAEADAASAEAAEFLRVIAGTILCERQLPLGGDFLCESGGIYRRKALVSDSFQKGKITNSIQAGFDLMTKVFADINSENYNEWYTRTSHMVRHGITTLYTLPEICTATAYLCENGTALITQLATLPDKRGQGHASRLLDFIAQDTNAEELILLSQSAESDSFYEHIGFERKSEWRMYEAPSRI